MADEVIPESAGDPQDLERLSVSREMAGEVMEWRAFLNLLPSSTAVMGD